MDELNTSCLPLLNGVPLVQGLDSTMVSFGNKTVFVAGLLQI